MMVLVEQSPDSSDALGIERRRVDALEQAIHAALPDLVIPSRREGLRWLEIIEHAPVTVVHCHAELSESGNSALWSLVVRYAVPGVRWVSVSEYDPDTSSDKERDVVVLDLLPTRPEPEAVWPVPHTWQGRDPVDMTAPAAMIAEVARRAPMKPPPHLRLGMAGVRYHAALMTAAAAKRSIVALAGNEIARAEQDGQPAPSGRDQARRAGISAPLLGQWHKTWRGVPADEDGELIPSDDEDTTQNYRPGVIL
jgi:hypothetical protein